MQQRYYDPQLGRFLSVDPIAVDTGSASNFSRYRYGGDNPYKFADPDGRQEFPLPSGVSDPSNIKTRADAEAHSRGADIPKILPTAEQVAKGLDHVGDASSNVEAGAIIVTGVSAAAGQVEVAVPAATVAKTAGVVTVGARVAAALISPSKERTKAAVTEAATMGAGSAAKTIDHDLEKIVVLSSKAVEKLTEP